MASRLVRLFSPPKFPRGKKIMAIVGTLTVDLVANTASFEGGMKKASSTARTTSKEIQDSFNRMDISEARGGMMLFDELIGVHMPRHATAFISQIPGFAAAFSAMFPVAAITVAIVAIDKAFESVEKHREAIEKNMRTVQDHADALGKHAVQMDLATLKIQDQVALLEGRPSRNRLKEALDEAKISAMDLFTQIERTNLEAIKDMENFKVSKFTTLMTGGTTTPQIDEAKAKLLELTNDTHKWRDAIAKGDEKLTSTFKDKIQSDITALKVATEGWKAETDKLVIADVAQHKKLPRANEPDPVAAAESRQKTARDLQNFLLNLTENTQSLITNYEKEENAKRSESAAKAVQDRISLYDKQYANEKRVTDASTKEAIAAYQVQFDQGQITAEQLADLKQTSLDKQYDAEMAHLEQVKALQAGRPELVKEIDQQIQALEANHAAQILHAYAATLNEQKNLNKALILDLERDWNADVAVFQRNLAAKNKAIMDAAKAQQDAQDRILQLTRGITDAEAVHNQQMAIATGHMTEQRAVQQALQTLEKSKADALANINRELDAQLAKVNALKALGATSADPQYNKAVADYQATLAKKLELTKQFNALEAAEQLKLANNERSQWNKMFLDYAQVQTHMSQLTRQTFGQMNASIAAFVVTGTGNFRQLAVGAAESFIQMALQYGESKAAMAIIDALFSKKKQITNVGDAMGGAMAGAARTLADVPYPLNIPASTSVMGIGMGYVAAAAAALSAERGALLPNREAMVHTHPEEMILPQHISNFIVNAASTASGGGQRGGDTNHWVYAPVIHAVDGTGVERLLKEHGDKFERHMTVVLRRRNY
jgi:hypothetical protein